MDSPQLSRKCLRVSAHRGQPKRLSVHSMRVKVANYSLLLLFETRRRGEHFEAARRARLPLVEQQRLDRGRAEDRLIRDADRGRHDERQVRGRRAREALRPNHNDRLKSCRARHEGIEITASLRNARRDRRRSGGKTHEEVQIVHRR
eukprot:1464867-Pleurochrysis_carterae.AAC.4